MESVSVSIPSAPFPGMVSARHSEGPPLRGAAIPKAVIQGLREIVLDIVSYYLAFKGDKGAVA